MQRKLGAKPLQQARQTRHHIRLQPDLFRQGHPHPEMRCVRFRSNRLCLCAQRLIQPQHRPLTEAPCQGRARQRNQIRDSGGTDAGQRVSSILIDPQRRDRQMPDDLGQPSVGDVPAAVAGQRVRGPARSGSRSNCGTSTGCPWVDRGD